MAKRPLPSPEVLRQLLRYEPETGKLFWKERPRDMFETQRHCAVWNARYSGKEAFTAIKGEVNRYKVGRIFDVMHRAHRVAWAVLHGEWPKALIDHRNGDGLDNRADNLREATVSQNGCNRPASVVNTSGRKGVTFDKRSGRWRAQIRHAGKNKYLGDYADIDDAAAAYGAAAIMLHGDFAHLG